MASDEGLFSQIAAEFSSSVSLQLVNMIFTHKMKLLWRDATSVCELLVCHQDISVGSSSDCCARLLSGTLLITRAPSKCNFHTDVRKGVGLGSITPLPVNELFLYKNISSRKCTFCDLSLGTNKQLPHPWNEAPGAINSFSMLPTTPLPNPQETRKILTEEEKVLLLYCPENISLWCK